MAQADGALRLIAAGCGLALALSGCGAKPDQTQRESRMDLTAAASALESAALDSGAIQNAAAIDPTGLFRTTHEAGADTLCVMPRSDARKHAFGLEVNFGESQYCRGRGLARQAGDSLILHFERYGCILVAQYEGDRIVLPGAVDMRCDNLCTNRASLAGVVMARQSAEGRRAGNATDRDGNKLCR